MDSLLRGKDGKIAGGKDGCYTQLPLIMPAGILEKPVIPDKVSAYEMLDLQTRGSR